MRDDPESPQPPESASSFEKQILHTRACAAADLEMAKIFEELATEAGEPDSPIGLAAGRATE